MSHAVSENSRVSVLNNHVIRPMKKEDIPECIDIFKGHGGSPSIATFISYYLIDSQGCFVLTTNTGSNSETIISFCCGNKYDPRCALVSFYATRLGYEGLGLGSSVWNETVNKYLKDCPNIGLCSSKNAEEMYQEKAGFKVKDHIGMLVFKSNDSKTHLMRIKPTTEESIKIKVIPVTESNWNQLVSYDKEVSGLDRNEFLKLTLDHPGVCCFIAIDAATDTVVGYSAVKPTKSKNSIGPLYANDYITAKVLFHEMMSHYEVPESNQNGLIMCTLDSNKDAMKLANDIGLTSDMIPSLRLFTKNPIEGIKFEKVYGLLSPAGFS